MKISSLEPQKGRTWPLSVTDVNDTLVNSEYMPGLVLPGDKVTSGIFWRHCNVCSNFRSKDHYSNTMLLLLLFIVIHLLLLSQNQSSAAFVIRAPD